ncbi:MAG: hypothetical protein OXF51_06190 [Alphaproteobacteria bacterium]|nr:hypothetical protein [Alphaproteobacteria bacterium]
MNRLPDTAPRANGALARAPLHRTPDSADGKPVIPAVFERCPPVVATTETAPASGRRSMAVDRDRVARIFRAVPDLCCQPRSAQPAVPARGAA